jgi:hypothetical protein
MAIIFTHYSTDTWQSHAKKKPHRWCHERKKIYHNYGNAVTITSNLWIAQLIIYTSSIYIHQSHFRHIMDKHNIHRLIYCLFLPSFLYSESKPWGQIKYVDAMLYRMFDAQLCLHPTLRRKCSAPITRNETCALLGCYAASGGNFLLDFGRICQNLWPLKTELTSSPEISVRNYHYSLRNKPEERSSHLLSGGSLRSRIMRLFIRSLSSECCRLFLLCCIICSMLNYCFGLRAYLTQNSQLSLRKLLDWLHPDVLLIQFIELNTTGFRLAHQ